MNIFKRTKKNESGEIFIETSIMMAIVLIVLSAMIGVGFYIYQKSMLSTIAAETANYAAKNYKYTSIGSIDATDIDEPNMINLKKYRSYLSLLNSGKISSYAKKRGRKTSFTKDSVTISEVKLIRDGIGRQRIKLTLKMKANIVFENIMVAIGLVKENPTISATAYSECLDLTEYNGQVYFVKYMQNGIQGSNIGGSMDNVGDTISTVKRILNKIVK